MTPQIGSSHSEVPSGKLILRGSALGPESSHLLAVAVGVALPYRVRQDLVEKAVRFFGRGRRRSEQNPIHDGRYDAFQQELCRRR